MFGEFPEAMCFMMAGVWLSMITIGFIPSNEGYEALFKASNLGAGITDKDGQEIYRSKNVEAIKRREIRLHRKQVHGGYVYWQDDITELNEICRKLEEIRVELEEEASIISLENRIKEEKAGLKQRTRCMTELQHRFGHSQRKSAVYVMK